MRSVPIKMTSVSPIVPTPKPAPEPKLIDEIFAVVFESGAMIFEGNERT